MLSASIAALFLPYSGETACCVKSLPLVPYFLVAMFKTKILTTSVLLSQCSRGGSAPLPLCKCSCWDC